MPRTIREASHICHICWVAADRAAIYMISGPSTSSQKNYPEEIQDQNLSAEVSNNPSIVLPNYIKAVETERRCFIEGCQRTERHRVPTSMRKMLLNVHKYYIPENNRLCDRHLVIESWDFLTSLRNNYVNKFTARHIEDMMTLKEVINSSAIQFDNIDNMEEHVVHTWIR